jgi:hypothetical protein
VISRLRSRALAHLTQDGAVPEGEHITVLNRVITQANGGGGEAYGLWKVHTSQVHRFATSAGKSSASALLGDGEADAGGAPASSLPDASVAFSCEKMVPGRERQS